FGSGCVQMPGASGVLFLPQRPYLPIGTLRDVVAYPARDKIFSEDDTRGALRAVGLEHLLGRLGEQQNWSMQLSPGEQQRVAFARALLQQPAWLFLDEATSALDENAEQQLYRMLKDKLPGTTLISIGHRSTLLPFHTRVMELRDDSRGLRILAPA
ncbi:MAG TPA: ATP-binding cassette domain-containing protein, partial [Burkholderiales bacterium]